MLIRHMNSQESDSADKEKPEFLHKQNSTIAKAKVSK